MSQNTLKILLCSVVFSIIATSCTKGKEENPMDEKDIASSLPKQIIWTSDRYVDEPVTTVYSMKYDTLNRKVEIYVDDTTNTNPYDILRAYFLYNKDGYLIKTAGVFWPYQQFDFWDEDDIYYSIVKINRSPDNKIISVIDEGTTPNAYTEIPESSSRDTTYYSYSLNLSGTQIITTNYDRYYPEFTEIITYSYDKDFKLLIQDRNTGLPLNFQYNPNGSLQSINTQGSDTHNFSYGIPSQNVKKDLLANLLLGKDYYVHQIASLYPFNFQGGMIYGETHAINITNPYYCTHSTRIYPQFPEENTTVDLRYEFDENNRLKKAMFYLEGELSQTVIFKY